MPSDENRLVAGRYRLGQRIGSGAMGIVWQAHDERLHRTVAVKQLLQQPGLSKAQAEEGRLRSMREGRIAARLQHPNAITVYDVAEDDGQPWLIMEYLPSRSLAAVLDDRLTLPPQEAARIGTEVATALVAAHAAGIVHRDIKPANVLLADDGTVKITDFGISRAVGDVTVTATGMLAGTPAYLAPEVAKGEAPTSASDVFSLGSTMYICVEGHSPFGLSDNTLALLHAVAAGKITPPRQAGPLTALLMRLLRTLPEERPTMTAAKEALAAIAAGRPVPPGLISGTYDGPTVSHRAAAPQTPPKPLPQLPPVASAKHPATRLDANPLAEPRRTPSSGFPMAMAGPIDHEPGRPPGAPKPPTDVKRIVFTVLAIIAAAAVGVLVASLFTDKTATNASTTPTGTPKPQVTITETASPKATTKNTTTTTTTSSTTTSSTEPQFNDGDQLIQQYYDYLPDDLEAAWAMLTPKFQQATGGKETYVRFWQGIDDVKVHNINQDGKTVTATVQFKVKAGRNTNEPYRFTLAEQNGQLLIDDARRTNS